MIAWIRVDWHSLRIAGARSEQFPRVKQMIRGIGVERTSTYSQTLNRQEGTVFPAVASVKKPARSCAVCIKIDYDP